MLDWCPSLVMFLHTSGLGSRLSDWLIRSFCQGDQFISPFLWALENGSETICNAMLKDLLKIRADRARYYYGAEDPDDSCSIFCEHVGKL